MNYSMRGAAAAADVKIDRIRTWERRFGVPAPARSATGRRLYTDADVAVIRRIAALVDSGVPAVDAAEIAQAEDAAGPPASTPKASPPHDPAREPPPQVAAFVDAVLQFEQAAALAALRSAVDDFGWGEALDRVLMLALAKIGDGWRRGDTLTTQEHFASELIRVAIAQALLGFDAPATGAPLVLMAAPAGERHDLGMLGLALLLHQRGIEVIYLGADCPTEDLRAAVDAMKPDVVCLAAVTPAGGASLEQAARRIVPLLRGSQLFVGGPGMANCPESVPGGRLPKGLQAAADLVFDRVQ